MMGGGLAFSLYALAGVVCGLAAIAIGHLNHANIKLTWGPLKYVLNNPVMHLYHHAYHLPQGKFGVNFGISLSLWDYLFGTKYIPDDSGTIPLGFPGDESFPRDFIGQNLYGFRRSRKSRRNRGKGKEGKDRQEPAGQ